MNTMLGQYPHYYSVPGFFKKDVTIHHILNALREKSDLSAGCGEWLQKDNQRLNSGTITLLPDDMLQNGSGDTYEQPHDMQ